MSLTNIDDKLLNIEAGEPVSMEVDLPDDTQEIERVETNEADGSTDLSESTPITSDEKKEDIKNNEESATDDYGSEIATKERVYTESEVQAMIRDRLSRGRQQEPQQPTYQPPQQTAPEYDPNSADSWEVQLESFIDNTISKREQQRQQQDWQRQEQETQANFEVRFNQGMQKYQDFEQVVMGKPLTPQMVISTRGMSDPAAFIYAAAKTQAPELERISKIGDPYAQAIELGRLEERMRKARSNVSQAPKPIAAPKGDMSSEPKTRKWSIDDKLAQADKENRAERMRGRDR